MEVLMSRQRSFINYVASGFSVPRASTRFPERPETCCFEPDKCGGKVIRSPRNIE